MFLVFDEILEVCKDKNSFKLSKTELFSKIRSKPATVYCTGTAVQLKMMYNSDCVDLKTGREFPVNIVITTLVVIS